MRLLEYSILLILILSCEVLCEDDVLVSVENGWLRGENRGHFYAFEGIPYAKPPVGDLRFASPKLYSEIWDGVRDATSPGSKCMQWDHFIEEENKTIGEEDCLFINVYTTSIKPKEKLPVIFYIHGGAFMFGYGHFYGPEILLQKPMVVVTFNYRLGPLGFLSAEDDVLPGNFGLKDQNVALKWVHRNIRQFNGDPEKITITGFSAGGASVHLHYLSPLSKGLFQNGIAHSGVSLNPWVFMEKSLEKTKIIAKNLKCGSSEFTTENVLKCLRTKPAQEVVGQTKHFLDFLYNPFSPFGVVVEKETKNNPVPFLTEKPAKLLEKGNFYKVPLIMSMDEDEGLYPAGEFMSNPNHLVEIEENWNKIVPSILDYKNTISSSDKETITKKIREHYMGDKKLTPESFRDFVKIITDRLYLSGMARAAKLQQSHAPVHIYFNRFNAVIGGGEFLAKSPDDLGVSHGDEVFLIYKTVIRDDYPYTEEEVEVAKNYVEMYYNFATKGKVMYGDVDILPMDCDDHIKYLEINSAKSAITKISSDFGGETFWKTIKLNEH